MAGHLDQALKSLRAVPRENGLYRLEHDGRPVQLELRYETDELERDILYLRGGEKALLEHLGNRQPSFSEEVERTVGFLTGTKFNNFITDRDGTVNNYCGRYRSSIQSAYNAVFLYRFARHMEYAVLLTSAPLKNIGLVDISVMPSGHLLYAGSKGREFIDKEGRYRTFPIDPDKESMLNKLNAQLENLLAQPEYQVYSLIGSGLQFKFGQTTVARQDINHSIPDQQSNMFLGVVRSLVRDLDPDSTFFRIEDTGMDIEIILTISDDSSGQESIRDFDKGDGIRFLDRELGMELGRYPSLVCGDTRSDIQMVRASLAANRDMTWSIFVSDDEQVRTTLNRECPNIVFVSSPDVLVSAFNRVALET
jgi:hypothetical protein